MKITKKDLEILFNSELSKLDSKIESLVKNTMNRRRDIESAKQILLRLEEINNEAIITKDY